MRTIVRIGCLLAALALTAQPGCNRAPKGGPEVGVDPPAPKAKPAPPEIAELLKTARELTQKGWPKQTEMGNWPDRLFVTTAALQTLVAVKSGDKTQLDEARKSADCCHYIGAKAQGYHVLALGQARAGDVAAGAKTLDQAAKMYASKKMIAYFQAHFAVASGDRSYFTKARETARLGGDAETVLDIIKIQIKEAVRARDKKLLDEARKSIPEFHIFRTTALAHVAKAQAQLGERDQALAAFADAAKNQRDVWDLAGIMADTATATGDERFLIEAEKHAARLEKEVGGLAYMKIAIAQAQRGIPDGDTKRFAQSLKTARKAESTSFHNTAIAGIIKAQAESAVRTKNVKLLEDAQKARTRYRDFLGSIDFSQSIGDAAIAAAEIRLGVATGDTNLRTKGIQNAKKLDMGVQFTYPMVAAALAETGHWDEHTQVTKEPSPHIFLGLAEGFMRQKGWWSADELACNSPGSIWLFN